MKVLQINCVHKKGSTGKISYDIHRGILESGYESVICYGRGDKTREKYVYKTCGELYSKLNNLLSRFTGIMYGGCFFSTNTLIGIIGKEKPDIVHLQCINGYFVNIYRLITYLKKKNIKTVLTLHAEFMYTANCGHALECDKWEHGCGHCPRFKKETKSLFLDSTALSWRKMKKAFSDFKDLVVVSVSPWLQKRAERSPILRDNIHTTVLNGLDTTLFYPRENNNLKSKLGIENKKIIFHATAEFRAEKDHLKGGYYVIELAKRFIKDYPDVIFLVAGQHNNPENMPPNVIFLGNIENQDTLAEYYSLADVTLLTSMRETFSMIVAESLCCGTPVVGFEAGAPEMIAVKEFSAFVPHGNVDELFKEVNLRLNVKSIDRQEISNTAHLKYSNTVMVKQYQTIYNNLLNNKE